MSEAHGVADASGAYDHPHSGPTVGEILRGGRESAGLKVEDVSAQLKLSPRQVRALEEERYDQLPGKAFLRGFVRNYARLLQLDGDALVAKLEAPSVSPMFGTSIAPTRGELPQAGSHVKVWQAWTLPAILLAVIAAGAYLEWKKPEPPVNAAPAVAAEPAATSTTIETPPPARVSNTPTTSTAIAPPTPNAAGSPNVARATAAATSTGTSKLNAALGEIELSFRERSWVEIRDRSGQVLMSQNNPAGSHQALKGTPPLSLVIGNAEDVHLIYNGKPVDLAPHNVKNVARITLR